MVQLKHLLSVRIIKSKITKSFEKPSKPGEYNGNGDYDKHVQLINNRLSYFRVDDVLKCKFFVFTLIGPPRLWFNGLPDESINSWVDICESFFVHFTTHKK